MSMDDCESESLVYSVDWLRVCVCVLMCVPAEIAVSFKALITGTREILGDSERISGKWNKDDKAC